MILRFFFLIITLAWTEPIGEQDVLGYKLYYNSSVIDVGLVLTCELPVETGTRYIMYVTAYNEHGESEPSNVVCYPALKLYIQSLPQGVLLTWQGMQGEIYTVYYADEPGEWGVLAENIVGSDRIMAYLDITIGDLKKRFYRIGLQ